MASVNVHALSSGGASNTDNTTYPTSSLTPPNTTEVVYVGVLALRAAGQTVQPTVAGTNGWDTTWTQIITIRNVAATIALSVFRGTPVSTTAGTMTATYTGETHDAGVIVPHVTE